MRPRGRAVAAVVAGQVRPRGRAVAPVVAASAATLAVAAPAVASTPPTPPNPGAAAAKVRTLDPEVRPLDPEVRPLRTETTTGNTTVVTLSADVLFDFDQATLTAAARQVVDDTGGSLADVPGAVSVVGHTDSIGTRAYNQDLSERRARAVADRLRATLSARPVDTAGRSFDEPVAPSQVDGKDNPPGRALNRRVVITVRR